MVIVENFAKTAKNFAKNAQNPQFFVSIKPKISTYLYQNFPGIPGIKFLGLRVWKKVGNPGIPGAEL